MKILLNSRAFHPLLGGIETVSQQLAEAWCKLGHDVRVWTETPLAGEPEISGLTVSRNPTFWESRKLVSWSDVVVQSGISLRALGPTVLLGRPIVYIHHAFLARTHGAGGVANEIKRIVSRLGTNVAVSEAVASTIPGRVTVIPNPYRQAFDARTTSHSSFSGVRPRIVVAARLVSEKGVETAVRAVNVLRAKGSMTELVICGDGPERHRLEQLSTELGLRESVKFNGWTSPHEIASAFRSADVVAIPSLTESFGVVALEAIASGAPVVASRVGGLPEAVGRCGILVPANDPQALADGIASALIPHRRENIFAEVEDHLGRHRIEAVAANYLRVFNEAATANSRGAR